jgi:hypothetical protein
VLGLLASLLPPRQWSATCPLKFINLVSSWKTFGISVHFDRILTESGFWATNFGTLPAGWVRCQLGAGVGKGGPEPLPHLPSRLM